MCGSQNIILKDVLGKKFLWMDYPEVELNVSLIHQGIMTCSECQNVLLRSSGMESLDNAIEQSIRNNLSEKTKKLWNEQIPAYSDYLKILSK